MTIKCSCVLAGHGRPITSESSVTPLFIQQPYARDSAFAIVYGCFSRIKKMLGRTEMRTRDRMYCQTIRSVWDISRGDRARIATCSLRTSPDRLTDRLKANYSIDTFVRTRTPSVYMVWHSTLSWKNSVWPAGEFPGNALMISHFNTSLPWGITLHCHWCACY